MDEPLQKSLERYDVLDRIAVGGMAEVFLAKAYGAHGFEKTLAIKRILPELARDPEFEARFIAEAKVAVRLSHANVVQVMDFGRIGDSLFIAMEYVDGLDLAAMLRKFKDEKRLVPLPAAFHIAIEIIRALDFAHSHSVVHRDVSPSNILVSRAGEVKIADFGIAVAAQPHKSGGTGARRVMGKWRYMSPEQTRGDTLDTRSDLFSAASVIYELFTNEKLFPGDEAEDIIKNIADMPIPRMSALRPGLPSRLDDVLGGALARKPIDRPSRPATVLRSLIELSYESSIMATALDVAEALATVIPAKRVSGRGALDDVIRKQLADQSVARRTAVTDGKPPSTETAAGGEVSTGLFRKIDLDGLSRLEEVDANTRVAAPRARRNSEQGEVMPGDTDLHKLYEASKDKDRHTEVGGPPTGQVPKAAIGKSTGSQATFTGGGPPRALWIVLALIVLGGGSAGIWALTRNGEDTQIVTPAPADAAPVKQEGKLLLTSEPKGASGYIEVVGAPGSRREIPPLIHEQPQSIAVPADRRLHLHLELAGHLPYDEDNIQVPLDQLVRLPVRLRVAPAKLSVITDPPGAQVMLGGRILGETPRTFESLTPATGVELSITRAGYQPFSTKIDLKAGATTEINETLKETQKFGYVKITVTQSWAHVYLNGRLLGKNKETSGVAPLQVPVGRHQLVLKNSVSGKQKTLVVNIAERKTSEYTVSFD